MKGPEIVYIIVDTEDGAIEIGGGSSTPPRVRAFDTLARAERSLKAMVGNSSTVRGSTSLKIVPYWRLELAVASRTEG